MKIDNEKLTDARDYAISGQKKGVTLAQFMSNDIEIPIDEVEYSTLNFSELNDLIVSVRDAFMEVHEMILTFQNNLSLTEAEISGMEISYGDEGHPHLHIGDNVTLEEGIKYYGTGRGEGGFGTVGSEREAGNDFHIDRVAFYVNGVLVANIDDKDADIEELRAKYAEENGVDVNDVEMSFCIGKGDGLAAGWIMEGDQGLTYEKLNSQNIKKVEDARAKIQKEAESNLEDAMNKIQNEYSKSGATIQNQYSELKITEFSDYNYEPVSFWATVGESAGNAAVGFLKVPTFAVTGAVDISTNLVTFGHGTHLTAYENQAFEELADATYRDAAQNAGGVSMDDYKTLQEISGAFLWAPIALEAAAPAAAPTAGEYVSIGGEVYVAGSPEALAAAEAAEAATASSAAASTAASSSAAASSAATATMEGLTAEQEVILATHQMEAAFAEFGVTTAETGAAASTASSAAAVTMEGLTVEQEVILATQEMQAAFTGFGVTTAEAGTATISTETGAIMAAIP